MQKWPMRRQKIMARCGLIALFFLLLAVCDRVPFARANDDRLLDEIEAGVDANLALIRQGTAKYREIRYKFLDGVEQGTEEVIVDSIFVDDRIQWRENRGGGVAEVWHLSDEEDAYFIQPAGQDDPPTENNIIRSQRGFGSFSPRFCDPRMLGHGIVRRNDQFISVADLIRSLRSGDSPRKLSVERDASEYKVVSYFPPTAEVPENLRAAKDEYWVSPSHGYGIVRVKQWGRSDFPAIECEAKYERTPSGAWVATRYERKRRFCARACWFLGNDWSFSS